MRHRLHVIEHVVSLSLKMLFFHYQAFLVLAKLDVSIQSTYSFVSELREELS